MDIRQCSVVLALYALQKVIEDKKSLQKDILAIKQKEADHDYGWDGYETTDVAFTQGKIAGYDIVLDTIDEMIAKAKDLQNEDKNH